MLQEVLGESSIPVHIFPSLLITAAIGVLPGWVQCMAFFE